MDTPAWREDRLGGIQPQPLPRTWLTCWQCGHQSPTIGGLHKHLHHTHKLDAWTYYWLHPEALQLRFQANIELEHRHEHLGPCWKYKGRRTFHNGDMGYIGQGYCQMRIAGAPTEAVHRLALFAFTGVLPDALVLHACDYPPCCNPAHLSEGSHTENMAERSERRRTSSGVDHYRAALSVEQVHEARRLFSQGWKPADVARRMEVDKQVMERLRRGESYRHVALVPELDDADVIPF